MPRADRRKLGQQGGARSCAPNPSDVTAQLCRDGLAARNQR
jgi:hypothetical protein